jgi:hypothetical protein
LNSDTVLFGKIGLYMWDSKSCVQGVCESDDGNDLFYGGGVGFDMVPGTLGDTDATTLGLSYSFPFGK